jgi:ABC-type multidrug transport system ATPase subunit
MFAISLENIGRRFNRDWIFKKVDYRFVQGESYAILGPNGSGKSTFLQVVAGNLSPSVGTLSYTAQGEAVETDQVFKSLSLSAPYLELIEEFTLEELFQFHFRFKQPVSGMSISEMIDLLGFPAAKDKEIRHFSSGMKQRTKLVLSCCSDTPLLFLDEPTANLDTQGIDWYRQLIGSYAGGRLLLICSNQEHEYDFCQNRLRINDYK